MTRAKMNYKAAKFALHNSVLWNRFTQREGATYRHDAGIDGIYCHNFPHLMRKNGILIFEFVWILPMWAQFKLQWAGKPRITKLTYMPQQTQPGWVLTAQSCNQLLAPRRSQLLWYEITYFRFNNILSVQEKAGLRDPKRCLSLN